MAQPIAPAQQAQAVKDAWKTKLELGQTYAIVEAKWWNAFKAYVGFDDMKCLVVAPTSSSSPGPIDNSRLQGAFPAELRKDIAEMSDYQLVEEGVWRLLLAWYGGGPAFIRRVIEVGLRKKTRVDLHPQFFSVRWANDLGEPEGDAEVISVDSKATFKAIAGMLATARNVPADPDDGKVSADSDPFACGVRIWIDNDGAWTLIDGQNASSPLDTFQLKSGHNLLAEIRTSAGAWPRAQSSKDWRDFAIGDIIDAQDTVGKWYESTIRDVKDDRIFVHYNGWPQTWDEWLPKSSERLSAKNSKTSGPRSVSWGAPSNQEGPPEVNGAVGLGNLGNTCFMNSTLQCLSNSPVLTDFFLDDDYLSQINRENPLGWQGRIADEYGALLKELWGGKYRVVLPSKFKQVLGEFAPRFSGYNQQDSSELLSFLLDGLHEDLNQVRVKPPTQTVESKGRPDSVVAAEAWDTHLKRNRSVIVDLLQGQLKSTLVCPICARVSITFDPFMFLSAPLPGRQHRTQTVAYMPSPIAQSTTTTTGAADAPSGPRLYAVKVPMEGSIKDLKLALGPMCGTSASSLFVVDVFSSRAYRVLYDHFSVAEIQPTDHIFVYDLAGMLPAAAEIEAASPAGSGAAAAAATAAATGAGAAVATAGEADPGAVEGAGAGAEVPGAAAAPTEPAKPSWSVVQVVHQRSEPNPSFPRYSARESIIETVGMPFLVALNTAAATVGDVKRIIGRAARRWLATASAQSAAPASAPPTVNGGADGAVVAPSPAVGEADVDTVTAAAAAVNISPPSPPLLTAAALSAMSDEELIAWLNSADAPFRVTVMDPSARYCARCPYSAQCDGCVLPDDNALLLVDAFPTDRTRYYTVSTREEANEPKANWSFGLLWRHFERDCVQYPRFDELSEHESVVQERERAKNAPDAVMKLEDCLSLFTQSEVLSKEDPWYCGGCKDFVQASKKFDLWKLPELLVVHLKRFSYTRVWRDKIDTFVDFPIDGLDLSGFCSNPDEHGAVYDLYAISNHYGGMGGGHYTAYCKNLVNGLWYHLDDSSATRVQESDLKTTAAYVLFYRRRKPAAPPS